MSHLLRATSPLASPSPSSSPSLNLNRLSKSAADFEAALLDPQRTIFLSGSPVLDGVEEFQFQSPLLPSGVAAARKLSDTAEEDVPEPIEKRSFEQDYRLGGTEPGQGPSARTPETVGPAGPEVDRVSGKTQHVRDMDEGQASGNKGIGVGSQPGALGGTRQNGAGAQTAIGLGEPAVAQVSRPEAAGEATNRGRRDSYGTTVSAESGGAKSVSARYRQMKAVGLDEEIALEEAANTLAHKKRSIFRSPGTASSPDLATLVRRAKETKYKQPPSTSSGTSAPKTLTKPPPADSTSASRTSISRDRAVSSLSTAGSSTGWDRVSNGDIRSISSGTSGDRMATIAEGSRKLKSGTSHGSDENFKSMRNKAKGMFGRMFGSSTTNLPNNTPARLPSNHFPPVPPIPHNYQLEVDAKKRAMGNGQSSSSQPATAPQSPQRAPSTASPRPSPGSGQEGRIRVPSSNSGKDKPLPVIHTDDQNATPPAQLLAPLPAVQEGLNGSNPPPTTRTFSSETQRKSLHVRQPADSSLENEDHPPRLAAPTRLATVESFSEDVAGMLSGIGDSQPANELGLPPDSLRLKDRRAQSSDVPRQVPSDVSSWATPERRGSHGKIPPLPSPRTTSLPRGTSSTSENLNFPRPPSSTHLEPVSRSRTPVSRSSSTASTSRRKDSEGGDGDGTPKMAPTEPATQTSAQNIAISESDFGPRDTSNEATIRARSREASTRTMQSSPFVSNSIRLISSPRPDRSGAITPTGDRPILASTTQSPTSALPNGDAVEEIVAPDEEDEEEKGRRLACEFLENDETSVTSEKQAMFLGGPKPINQIALRYYMRYFDMKGQNLVNSFRELCQKLHLKAESQEIDRIIEAFSARYFECNPSTVFGTPGVVHTVTGAMLMLNTDLHIADLTKHMSRTDFVRNSMRAIQESMPVDAVANGTSTPDLVTDDSEKSFKSPMTPFGTLASGSNSSMATSMLGRAKSRDGPVVPPTQRSTSAPVMGLVGTSGMTPYIHPGNAHSGSEMPEKARDSTATFSSFSYSKAWEAEAESALRDIYANVRTDRILLPISGISVSNGTNKRQSVMSVGGIYDLGRKSTIRSPSGGRVNALKRSSVAGSQSLLNHPYGSNFAGSDGRLSPTPSYATSINDSFGFAPTIGFASNLTHSVIREHDDEVRSVSSNVSTDTQDELNDDELALLGAPWAKEGILTRKMYLDDGGKRAKKSDWKQVFVVIQKGELMMFTFGEGKGSGGSFGIGGGTVGGGNWTANASAVGGVSLMHAMAQTLPRPGFSTSRPNCFSIAQPTGEVNFFRAGTEDLVLEWIQTCNYWAARTSRQPLQGGVSNMEYGWNRALDETQAVAAADDIDDRASVRSGRSSMSKLAGSYGRKNVSGAQGDRVFINDWKPPPAATMASPLDEESQLEALAAYVKSLAEELEQHKAIEASMMRLYSLGSKNAQKARENWKAKSQYILSEIFKYETYLDSLRHAISSRVKEQGKRKLDRSLRRSVGSLHLLDEAGK